MKKIGDFISETLSSDGQIPEEQKAIYSYLFDYIIEALLFDLLVLLFGIFTHRLGMTLCYLVVTIPMRHFAGGFHASTPLKCTILSYGTFFIAIFATPALVAWMNHILWIPIYIMLWISVLAVAPVDTPNKRLDSDQKKRLYKLCIVTCIVMTCLFAALWFFGFRLYCGTIDVCLFICSLGLYIGLLINRRDKSC